MRDCSIKYVLGCLNGEVYGLVFEPEFNTTSFLNKFNFN